MFRKVTIIGDGAMGSVCAMLLCKKGLSVTMWGYDAEQLGEIAATRENKLFLPGHKLGKQVVFEPGDDKALCGADIIISAVPCQFTRTVWDRLKPFAAKEIPIVSVTKGIENKTLLRPTEILADVLGEGRYATLSGPTIADELASGLPATATAACADEGLAKKVQKTFNSVQFRIYTNTDIVGVELSGAVKNVIAIAAGIIDGIKAGDNAKAALVTRGLAEIKRLGAAMGAREKTFGGLSGLGDLVTTCISPKGRNRSFGEKIGKGMSTKAALSEIQGVVEGVATCESVLALAEKYGVEMPITKSVHAVIVEGESVQAAIRNLMSRQLKSE